MNSPFIDFAEAQARQLARRGDGRPSLDWRSIERALIRYLISHRVRVVDAAGEPHVELVRWRGVEDIVTVRLSIEALAKYLAGEPS